LEAQFQELVNNGTKLIALVGPPGMGKTWLAEAVTRAEDNSKLTPLIRADDQFFANDVDGAFKVLGIRPPKGSPKDKLDYLLMSPDYAPATVVLDNLESSDELNSLIPHTFRPRIVATCRLMGGNPPATAKFLEVESMKRSESIYLVINRLTTLSEKDAAELASRLGDWPLLLDYICKFALTQHLPILTLCDEFTREARESAGFVPVSGNITLSAALRRMIRPAATGSPLVRELLKCLVFLSGVRASEGFLISYLSAAQGRPVTRIEFAHTVHRLRTIGIIRSTDFLLHSMTLRDRGVLSRVIHPFTMEILLQEFWPDATRVAELFAQASQANSDGLALELKVEESGKIITITSLNMKQVGVAVDPNFQTCSICRPQGGTRRDTRLS
jgi:hypothetical protein